MTRALDEVTNTLLATHKDGSGVHGPAALRAGLVKLAIGLAQQGVEPPPKIVELVGEVAAEAGVMDGQPRIQMRALLELHFEKVLPEGVPVLLDKVIAEAEQTGPDAVLRLAAVLTGLVAAGGEEKKKKKATTSAGPLARFVLQETTKKPPSA